MPKSKGQRRGPNDKPYQAMRDKLQNDNFTTEIFADSITASDADTTGEYFSLRLTDFEREALEEYAVLPVRVEQYDAKMEAYKARREQGLDVPSSTPATQITQAIYYRLTHLMPVTNIVGSSIDRIGISLPTPDGDANPEFCYILTVKEHKNFRLDLLDGLRPLTEPWDDGVHAQGYNPAWADDTDFIIAIGLHDDVASHSNPTSDELAPYIAPLIAAAAAIALPELIEAGAVEEITSGLIGEGAPFTFFGPNTSTELPLIGAPKIRALPPPIEIEIPGVPAIHVPHIDYNVYSDQVVLQDGTHSNALDEHGAATKGTYLGAKRKVTLPGMVGLPDALPSATIDASKIVVYAPGDVNAPAGTPSDRYAVQYQPKITTPSATHLSGSFTRMVGNETVNLTTEGVTDWVHYASPDAKTAKNLGPNSISQVVGASGPFGGASQQGQPVFVWSDGQPTQSGSDFGGYYSFDTLQIHVPASTTSQHIRVYVGVYFCRGRLTAHLGDSSSPDYSDASLQNDSSDGIGGNTTGYYDILFASGTDTTLTISYIRELGHGNVHIHAATLNPDTFTPPLPSGGGITITGSNDTVVASENGGIHAAPIPGGWDISRVAPTPAVHVYADGIEGVISDSTETNHRRRNINLILPITSAPPPPPPSTPSTPPTPPPHTPSNTNPPPPDPSKSVQVCFPDAPYTLINDFYVPTGTLGNDESERFIIHMFDNISNDLHNIANTVRGLSPDVLGPYDRIDAWVLTLQTSANNAVQAGPVDIPAGIFWPKITKGGSLGPPFEPSSADILNFHYDRAYPWIGASGGLQYSWDGSKQVAQTDNGNYDNWKFFCKFFQSSPLSEIFAPRGLFLAATCVYKTPYQLSDFWHFAADNTNPSMGELGNATATPSIVTQGNPANGFDMTGDAIHGGGININWLGTVNTAIENIYVSMDVKLDVPGGFNFTGVQCRIEITVAGVTTVGEYVNVGADNQWHNIGLSLALHIEPSTSFGMHVGWTPTGGQNCVGDNLVAYCM